MKGKYAVRAESRTNKNLEYQVATLKAELEASKADVRQLRQENTRLKAIEAVFDGTKDVIAELEAVKRERSDLSGRNFVLEDRLRRWAKVIMSESNRDFVNVNPQMVEDIIALGYWSEDLNFNRASKRNTKTSQQARKIRNLQKAAKEATRA